MPLSKQDLNTIMNLIDLGVKNGGLNAAVVLMPLATKVQALLDAAANDTVTALPVDPQRAAANDGGSRS